jgi:ABC-type glycerol-3-phosphate transport system substrate-binding protein
MLRVEARITLQKFSALEEIVFKKSLRHLNLLAVLALLIVAALHPSSGKAQENPTALTYVYPAFAPVPKDLQAVQDAINAILVKKINATVTLRPIDGSAYDQKIKLDLAAGEKFDVIFTAPWINNYYQNVAQGNFYALDDLLKTKVPNLCSDQPARFPQAMGRCCAERPCRKIQT